jgi:tetratricopeptide (TPR) repeat protein
LARTLDDRAIVLMRLEDRRDKALDASRRAVAILESLIAGGPSASLRRALALALVNVAQIQHKQGHPPEAIETLRRALALDEQMAAEDPRAIEPRIAAARAHGLLAQILMEQPDGLRPALAASQQAVDQMEEVVRENPGLANQAYVLAMYLSDLSTVQQMAGKLDSALRSARRSIELLERIDRQYPGSLNYRGSLASSCNMLSDLHRRRGEPAESLAVAEKARDLLERLVAEHPEDTYSRIDLSKSFNNIGRMQQQSGDPAEALRSFQRAVDLLEGLPDLDARNNYNLACNLALCLPLIGAKPGSQGVDDEEALTKGDQVRRKMYGDRAIEILRRAVRGGFLNAEILRSDPDLAPIRGHEEFRQILKDLEEPAATDGK